MLARDYDDFTTISTRSVAVLSIDIEAVSTRKNLREVESLTTERRDLVVDPTTVIPFQFNDVAHGQTSLADQG